MFNRKVVSTAILAALISGCDSSGDGDQTEHIHVIGSAANSNIYESLEEPFWTEHMPEASRGRIEVDFTSITESGLKGPQIARLLGAGALDVAYGDFGSAAGDLPQFEAIDLAGVITDLDTMHEASNAYKPVLDRIFNQHGIKLLGLFPFPQFAFFCTGDVASLEDLQGKKVRVYTQSMSDFVEEIGAVAVTIPFPDVVPALQTGVADCSVTGTYSGNMAGWAEVTDSLFTLPIGGGLSFYGYSARGWNELDPELRDFIDEEFTDFENAAWELTKKQTQIGINCNTGEGECPDGKPANMELNEPSPADIQRAHEIAREVVIPSWTDRCSDKCIREWNATVGEVVGIQAGGDE